MKDPSLSCSLTILFNRSSGIPRQRGACEGCTQASDDVQISLADFRDYLTAEKVIQGFLLAYLNISDFYISRTEKEMNKGFADIFLEPFLAKYPDKTNTLLSKPSV